MAGKSVDPIRSLALGSNDNKIKVRVIRLWRGVSTTGEDFKGFNVLLLDNKNSTIHAFIPAVCAYDHERKLQVGKVCVISKFAVEPYKMTDKFRSVRNDKKLIFSKATKIQDVEDTLSNIQPDWFDIYDHSDLKPLSQQNVYLADVVGIIKEHLPLNQFKNRHGKDQTQARFTITDGSSSLKVTFWDQFGDNFEKAMQENIEKPVIIIIASSRVGIWNEEVILSNVAATKFYLNYQHNSVIQLRKMLTLPGFRQQAFAANNRGEAELLSVKELLSLGTEYIETEFRTNVKVVSVKEPNNWYYNACTSCHNQTEKEKDTHNCIKCNRKVPYPDLKFKLCVVASDGTGTIDIYLDDREVRTLTGKRALQIFIEQSSDTTFPPQVKAIENKEYCIQLCISEANVSYRMKLFRATNICNGYKLRTANSNTITDTMQQSTTQGSTSTYHLDQISDLNLVSQQTTSSKETDVPTV